MFIDAIVYVLIFVMPALDLYGALSLADRKKSTRRTLPILRQFIVAVLFRTITRPLDFFMESWPIYQFAKLICVVVLIYRKDYAGAKWVYDRVVQPLAEEYPVVVEFAGESHEATLSGKVQFLVVAFARWFRQEYDRIFNEIDD
jgi:hypothetical protein